MFIGKKHKSPSKIERDNRRSDTWHAKQESNKIESEGEIDESEHSQSSEMETESEDEHIENTDVISPSVTPVQVNTLPDDVPRVVFHFYFSDHIICFTCPTKYNFLIMRICTWACPCYYR
jgi:hypothetical protein